MLGNTSNHENCSFFSVKPVKTLTFHNFLINPVMNEFNSGILITLLMKQSVKV